MNGMQHLVKAAMSQLDPDMIAALQSLPKIVIEKIATMESQLNRMEAMLIAVHQNTLTSDGVPETLAEKTAAVSIATGRDAMSVHSDLIRAHEG